MEEKATSGMMLPLLLICMLTLTLDIQTVEGWTGKVTIKADGSISPPNAPISSSDNVTYALADSIFGSIIVQRDDIIIDGAGHILQGTGREWTGMDLAGRTNVTVQNTHVKGFHRGISLYESSWNIIIANEITLNNDFGVILEHSSSNIVRDNNITANEGTGVHLLLSSDCNSISGNTIAHNRQGITGTSSSNYNAVNRNNLTNNDMGIGFYDSSNYNSIYGNSITNGLRGITFGRSSGNRVYRNFFIYNDRQAYIEPSGYANVWDNGFPSGGNYWSDYAGIDENKDGFGDTPYIIDAQNADYYPLLSSAPIVDIESPILSITNPYIGEVIRSSAVTISWEGIDYASGISHYTIAIDDEYSINVGLNTSCTFTELDNGQHVVEIAAFDYAGNTVYQSLDFSIDAGIRFAWPPYIAETLVMIAMVIALGIALYVLKSRYSSRIRKPDRRLIR